ncbi:MAG: FixH family protein [Boseongicola sp.]
MTREIKGWHVLAGFLAAFGLIIAVNFTLAFNAIATFPGLETKNSYVTSQSFEADRAAQKALDWTLDASVDGSALKLSFSDKSGPVRPEISQAILGRATHTGEDQTPVFEFDGKTFSAPVALVPGNWNLRLVARADNGATFRRRIVLKVVE